jgi:hypothetical protein
MGCVGTVEAKRSIVYKQTIAAVKKGGGLMRNAAVRMNENALTKALEFGRNSQERTDRCGRSRPRKLGPRRAELATPTLDAN